MSSNKHLCISSYNSTGYGLGAKQSMETLLLFSDILCIQEHFLLDSKSKKHSNTNKMRVDFGDNFDMFIVPASKDASKVSRGRGSGGLSILWKKSLTKYVSKVSSRNTRLQGAKFSFPGCDILVINGYFPCDVQTDNFDDTELIKTLQDMRAMIVSSDCQNVLFSGDLNCHFQRSNKFTKIIENVLNDIPLKIMWQECYRNNSIQDVDYTYCFMTDVNASFLTIDHFQLNEKLLESVIEAGVIHITTNLSNHSPIFCKIEVSKLDLCLEDIESHKKVSWNQATKLAKEEFKDRLSYKLNALEDPLCVSCNDLHCSDQRHFDAIDEYTIDVLQALETAGEETLPQVGGK